MAVRTVCPWQAGPGSRQEARGESGCGSGAWWAGGGEKGLIGGGPFPRPHPFSRTSLGLHLPLLAPLSS